MSSIVFTEIRICVSIRGLSYVVTELERITTNLYYIRAQSLARISFHKPRRDRSWIRIHVQSLWWVDRDLWHGVRYRLCHRRELPSESILPFCCRTLETCDIPKETIKTPVSYFVECSFRLIADRITKDLGTCKTRS